MAGFTPVLRMVIFIALENNGEGILASPADQLCSDSYLTETIQWSQLAKI